jgi:NTE family protein
VAIRASCAFPGLVKPVEHESHLLADGCIVAPVPAAIAARNSTGCVLGIDVGNKENISNCPKQSLKKIDLKGTALHRRPMNPSWARYADVVLEPEVGHIDWSDFSHVDEAVAAGAEAARAAIPSIREILSRRQKQLHSSRNLPFSQKQGLAL